MTTPTIESIVKELVGTREFKLFPVGGLNRWHYWNGATYSYDRLDAWLTQKLTQVREDAYNDGYGKCDAENEFEYNRGRNEAVREVVEKLEGMRKGLDEEVEGKVVA